MLVAVCLLTESHMPQRALRRERERERRRLLSSTPRKNSSNEPTTWGLTVDFCFASLYKWSNSNSQTTRVNLSSANMPRAISHGAGCPLGAASTAPRPNTTITTLYMELPPKEHCLTMNTWEVRWRSARIWQNQLALARQWSLEWSASVQRTQK